MTNIASGALDYTSPVVDVRSDGFLKFYRMRTFFFLTRLFDGWIVGFLCIGFVLWVPHRSASPEDVKWMYASAGAALSVPYFLVVRAAILRSCYPSPLLVMQSLILCINYGMALGIAV